MKQWIKTYKMPLLLSCVLMLVPLLTGLVLWEQLPEHMVSRFDVFAKAEGLSPKIFTVVILPLLLFALHILCVLVTAWDNQKKAQSQKVMGLVFWILPTVSLSVLGCLYAVALGGSVTPNTVLPLLFAVLFLVFGNYMPKIKPNRTVGIRVSYTLNSEENWISTHRFAGKVWVVGGLVLLVSVFLPKAVRVPVFVAVLLILCVAPLVYAVRFHQKQVKQENAEPQVPPSASQAPKTPRKATSAIGTVIPLAILIFAFMALFTGKIQVHLGDTAFTVDASYYNDLTVPYTEVDSVEYVENFDKGSRLMGFGSPKLSMGTFENESLGRYTLYAYTGAQDALILRRGEDVLVLAGKSKADTQAVFHGLSEKIPVVNP